MLVNQNSKKTKIAVFEVVKLPIGNKQNLQVKTNPF